MSSLDSVPAAFAAFHLLASVVSGCRVHASWKPLTVTNMKRILQSRRCGFGTAPLVPFILSLSNIDRDDEWGSEVSLCLSPYPGDHHTTPHHSQPQQVPSYYKNKTHIKLDTSRTGWWRHLVFFCPKFKMSNTNKQSYAVIIAEFCYYKVCAYHARNFIKVASFGHLLSKCPKERTCDVGNDESHKLGFHPNVKWTSRILHVNFASCSKKAVKATQVTPCRRKSCKTELHKAMQIAFNVHTLNSKKRVSCLECQLFLQVINHLRLTQRQLSGFFSISPVSKWQFTRDNIRFEEPTLTFRVGVFVCALQSGALWQVFLTLPAQFIVVLNNVWLAASWRSCPHCIYFLSDALPNNSVIPCGPTTQTA